MEGRAVPPFGAGERVVSKDILWSDRYITLTTEKIFIRNTQDREVRDTIGVCPRGGSRGSRAALFSLDSLIVQQFVAQVMLTCGVVRSRV